MYDEAYDMLAEKLDKDERPSLKNAEIANSCCYLSPDFRTEIIAHAEKELENFDLSWLFQNFTSYTPRQQIARFLAREKLFDKTKNIQGAIAEFGVFSGFGLFSWVQLRSIHKPLDVQKKILGFDTFEGFEALHENDKNKSAQYQVGDFKYESKEHLESLVNVHALNSYLPSQAKNVELVKGDASKTLPQYLKDNPHTLFSLVYLDMDLYEPTVAVLKEILPRMCKGGIIAFDQLNIKEFPGETTAFLEAMDINSVKIQNFDFDTKICFMEV